MVPSQDARVGGLTDRGVGLVGAPWAVTLPVEEEEKLGFWRRLFSSVRGSLRLQEEQERERWEFHMEQLVQCLMVRVRRRSSYFRSCFSSGMAARRNRNVGNGNGASKTAV